MNDSKGGVLALAVGGAAVGAAAGALVVSLLSGPQAVVPSMAGQRKGVTITLEKDKNDKDKKCKATIEGTKKVEVDYEDLGVEFEIYNEDCDEKQVFRLREKRTEGKRPVPVRCRLHALVPYDLPIGTSVDPSPVCDFPIQKRYKGTYEYTLQLCTKDETGCVDQDPEIEVRRR